MPETHATHKRVSEVTTNIPLLIVIKQTRFVLTANIFKGYVNFAPEALR